MSKKMEVSTAVHLIRKKKPMKRSRKKKNQLFKKVKDYLKSDYFMFSLFDSSKLSDSSSSESSPSVSTGVEGITEPTKENDKKLLQKIVDYLKLDSYLYGPLVTSQSLDLAAGVNSSKASVVVQEADKSVSANAVDGGSERASEPVGKTVNVITKGQNNDSVPHATSTVVSHTRVRREMVKRMIYQNC